MQDLGDLLDNRVLLVAIFACLLTQATKLIVELIKNHKLNFHVVVESGGMPSSHSALVTALAAGVGQTSRRGVLHTGGEPEMGGRSVRDRQFGLCKCFQEGNAVSRLLERQQ